MAKGVYKRKPRPLTPRQEKACQEFVRQGADYGNKSAAYRKAYDCTNWKPESVNRQAFAFFDSPNIISRIAALQAKAAKRNDISVDRILQEEKCLSFYDVSEMFHKDGAMKNIHDIPEPLRRAIAGVQVDEVLGRDSRTIRTKIKLADKGRALERISKHLGMYVERHEHTGKDGVALFPEMSDVEKAALKKIAEGL